MLTLMSEAPEMLQTAMYTIMTQPAKTAQWSVALQSWEGFCATPTDSIFSVPPGLNFDMDQFKSQMCSINMTALLDELNTYQGTDRLMALIEGGSLPSVNSSQVQEKFEHLLQSYTNTIVNQTASLPNDPFSRLFNETVWEQVGASISTWTDQVMDFSPQMITQVLTDTLTSLSPDIASLFMPVYNKAIAITNIVFDQLQEAIDSKYIAMPIFFCNCG